MIHSKTTFKQTKQKKKSSDDTLKSVQEAGCNLSLGNMTIEDVGTDDAKEQNLRRTYSRITYLIELNIFNHFN